MTDLRFLRVDLARGPRDVGHIRLSWDPQGPLWRVVEFNYPKTTEEPSQRRVVSEGTALPDGFRAFTDQLVELANDWEAGATKEVARMKGLADREGQGIYRGFRKGWAKAEHGRLVNQQQKVRRQYRPMHRNLYDSAVAAGWPIGPYVEPRFSWEPT